MAKSISFPLMVTKKLHIDDLYEKYKVDRTFKLDLAATFETLENVREGLCGAYLSFFIDYGLSFLIPEPVLDILVELDLSFTQMCPNFLRHLLVILVKAREERLLFGLEELRHLCLMKRSKQSLGIFLMSPHPGRQIIEGIPYPHSGSSPMTNELQGLIEVLHRGRPHWSSFDRARIRVEFVLLSGQDLLKVMEACNEFSMVMEDRLKGLREDEEARGGASKIQELTKELEAAQEENKRRAGELWCFKDEWKRARFERGVFESEVATLKTKKNAELEALRDRDVHHVSRMARREITYSYNGNLASLKYRWMKTKEEVKAEIQHYEVTANIDLLKEVRDEGLDVEEELGCLKEMEKDYEAVVKLAAVPEWSLSGFDLPQISKDFVADNGVDPLVPDEEASS
ncbi:hypothetical protein N665_0333s0007 [Sinapis alba]|nr:hypothetical protein N665_0333s0007 [Sinapis alba]